MHRRYYNGEKEKHLRPLTVLHLFLIAYGRLHTNIMH